MLNYSIFNLKNFEMFKTFEKFLLISFVIFFVKNNVQGLETSYGVTKLSSCKAQLDNGDIIDLTSLDNINALR